MIIIKFAFELIVIFRIQSGEIYMFIDRMEIIKKCFDVRFAGVFSKHHYLRCTLKQSLLYHGCIFEPLQLNFHKHSQVGSCSFHKRQRLYFNSSFLLNVFTKTKKTISVWETVYLSKNYLFFWKGDSGEYRPLASKKKANVPSY